jgi:hypothetical protein
MSTVAPAAIATTATIRMIGRRFAIEAICSIGRSFE